MDTALEAPADLFPTKLYELKKLSSNLIDSYNKATHALKFADCVEYYDDWGFGEAVKLDVYYRMCDQLVDREKRCRSLKTRKRL